MLVLVRYGEIGLKGKNRPQFERQLVRRIKWALEPLKAKVRRGHGRHWVSTDAPWEEVAQRLGRVFGIVAYSPVHTTALSPEAIEEGAIAQLHQAVGGQPASPSTVTFKVNARRANKRFPLNSLELNRRIGAAILASPPPGVELQVDLHQPDITINVEVRDDAAYIYAHEERGLGGLPVGVGGRALALLSGGIDSPVAAWLTMKRGVRVDAVHYHSYPFTSDRSKEKVLGLARVLARYGGPMDVHVVHFTEIQTAIYQNCPPELGITIMRRMMFRIAEKLARQTGALATVTGESLGQVASQTLESIHTISAVTRLPVLRPLITYDKEEIVRLSRQIGTYEISILPYEDCCSIFLPANPATRPTIADAEQAEAALDIDALIADALERIETITFSGAGGGEVKS